ncbi:hypothetical protein [Herbaspirillum huttiense]|uniref:hypothetical protein n=1 Tax=Herbaspirillum huttiense TaxID=863372 RepID=UPI0039B02545
MFKKLPVRVSFVCTNTTFGSFDDLTSSDGREHIAREGFRHYLICRAPRIIFESFDRTQKKVATKVQRGVTEFEQISIDIQTSITVDGISTELENVEYTKYPEIKAKLSNGAEFLFATCFEFLSFVAPAQNNLLILEVLYVGQTEPTEEYLRLEGHATFAKIVDRYLKSEPQAEIFIKLLKFPGPVYEYADNQHEVDTLWSNGVAQAVGTFPPDQMTSLIEAALIRACQPEFNTHYKTSFPSKKHKNYSFVFKVPIDEVEVIVSEELRRYRWKLGNEVGNALWLSVQLEN